MHDKSKNDNSNKQHSPQVVLSLGGRRIGLKKRVEDLLTFLELNLCLFAPGVVLLVVRIVRVAAVVADTGVLSPSGTDPTQYVQRK